MQIRYESMNLKRMRHALALAEARHFARAAEQLNLSQPALSRSIQLLEEELGLRLFDRDKRNVQITAVGAQFLARAARLAQEAQSLQRDMALTRDGLLGRLAFGAGPYPLATLVPALLTRLRQSHPGLQVQAVQDPGERLLSQLREERIEFFIAERRDLSPAPDLEIAPLLRLPVGLWVRAGHPLLVSAAPVKPQQLLPYGLASVTLTPRLQALMARALKLPPGEAVPVALCIDHLELLIAQTAASDMVLLAPQAAVPDQSLRPLVLGGTPALFADIATIHRQGRSLSPAAQLALQRLRELA